MTFEKITPEQAGISSKQIERFIKKLEIRGATTHGILMMKGNKIFTEYYWKPFHKDYCHRMYSQTKSFVGIAIGLLQEEGKLSIQDRIVDYFPERIDGMIDAYLQEQTIEDMLTMTTAGHCPYWFCEEDPDRTHLYLNKLNGVRLSGTLWEYDSAGSQVLCSLVEKLSGKKLLDYMKEKLFNRMGTFQTAEMLECPNGESWGDSAMLCTLRDMASFGRLLMQEGVWAGERLIDKEFVKKATSAVRSNLENTHYDVFRHGYGYQIWRTEKNGFAFVGLGDQLTLCFPDQDVLFAIISDNQGTEIARNSIVANFVDLILEEMQDYSLPDDKCAEDSLANLGKTLSLRCIKGMPDSAFRKELNDITYICKENPMGITEFTFHFNEDGKSGTLRYVNEQGEKELPFGVNYNVFGQFPQFGYANAMGRVKTTDGFTYKDAVSFAWLEEKKIAIFVQVIDKYFGNMSMIFSFKGDVAFASCTKAAQDFFTEYLGVLEARKG